AGLRSTDDLHLAPREAHATAERLAHRLFAGEPGGVALRRVVARVAVRTLALREAALAEARPLERPADALDLDHVDADLHEVQPPVRSSCRSAGKWASDETTMSGADVAVSSASGRNFPVRTSAVFIPKRWAPRTSASMSSVTSHVRSGSASSASSAAAKYDGLGFPRIVASTPVAYSSPATNAPPSS